MQVQTEDHKQLLITMRIKKISKSQILQNFLIEQNSVNSQHNKQLTKVIKLLRK